MKEPVKVKVSVTCLIEKDGKVLFVQEGAGKIKGLWSLPGGKVDEGETFEEAVERELKEETNLDVINMKEIDIVQEEPNHTVKHIYRVEAKGNLKSQIGEILDIKWFSPEEVKEMKDKLRNPWVLNVIENYL